MSEQADRPTPETDAYVKEVQEGSCLPTCDSFAHDELCPFCFPEALLAIFARKLEREREEARDEMAETWAELEIAKAKLAAAEEALVLAEVWLCNCQPIVEPTEQKPLPVMRKALDAIRAARPPGEKE